MSLPEMNFAFSRQSKETGDRCAQGLQGHPRSQAVVLEFGAMTDLPMRKRRLQTDAASEIPGTREV